MPPNLRQFRGARYKAWQTMRLFSKQGLDFTVTDLVSTDEAMSVDNIRQMLRRLLDHQYVMRVSGFGAATVYRLIRDTGPDVPVFQPDGSLIDRNTREHLPRRGE